MSHARRQQGERIQPLALDRFLRRAPALGNIAHDDGIADLFAVAGVVRGIFISVKPRLNHQRDDVKINEAIARIKNLEVSRDRTTTVGERIPIKSAHSFVEQFAYGILAVEAEKLAGGGIQISNAAG